MNERIKELLTDCNYQTDGTCDLSREIRFAELVVKECLSVCRKKVWDRYDNCLADGAGACIVEIKEHFGVKS